MKRRLLQRIVGKTQLAAVALPAFLLCGLTQVPAHANYGNWVFTGSYTVNMSGHMSGAPSGTIPATYGQVAVAWNGGGPSGASATMTVNITATWQPDPNRTPNSEPNNQPFLLTASAGGTCTGPYNGGESVNVNDGLGNTVTTSISGATNEYTQCSTNATDKALKITKSFQNTLTVSLAGTSQAGGSAAMSFVVAPDTRSAHITSFLGETTTYKGPMYTNPVPSDVYQRVSLPSGNSADSIVYPYTDPSTGNQTFTVSGNFNANAANFKQPTITWTIKGDGTPDPVLTVPYMSAPNSQSPYGVSTLPVGLNFGGPSWDLTKTKTTQISVKVVDTDGAVATDTYTVTWHAPQENMANIGVQHNVPLFVGTMTGIDKNASVPTYVTIPGKDGLIDWGDVAQKSSLPVNVAGASAGGLLLIPEIATGPYGWTVIAFQAIAAAAGAQLSMQSPTHPGTVQVQANANYHEYLGDVQIQIAKNAAGDTNYPHFVPQQNAGAALAGSVDPTQWESDPFFMNSTAQWQPGWYQDITTELADEYTTSGYAGHLYDSLVAENATFQYFKWTCTYNPPPPPK